MEDLNYLNDWYKSCLESVKLAKKNLISNQFLIYMIGTTSDKSCSFKPYNTPLRTITNGYVIGSVVFSQTQAIILASLIDGLVDYVFVDSEKKLPVVYNVDFFLTLLTVENK